MTLPPSCNTHCTRYTSLSFQFGAAGALPSARGATPLARADLASGRQLLPWFDVPLAPRPARYVRFVAVSFHGKGAGLHSLAIFARRLERATRPSHVLLDTVSHACIPVSCMHAIYCLCWSHPCPHAAIDTAGGRDSPL